VQQFSDKDP